MNILRTKVALIGDPRVGKTCIVSQLVRQYFNNTYQTTLGVDYNSFEIKIKDTNYTVQLNILDLTGFSVFRDVINTQLKDVNFILYVYDATNLESFQSIKLWKENTLAYVQNSKCVEYLIGNKCDLENKITVDETSAKNLANVYGFKTYSVSAVINHYLILKYIVAFQKYQ
jgi:small GTP-binding protein